MIRPLLATLLIGCGGESAPPPPAADASVPPAPGATVAERRARYEGRATVEPPREMPAAWRDLPAKLEAKLGRIEHEVRSRVDDAEPYRRVRMELRLFGTDAAVEARLLSALSAMKLPGLGDGLPTEAVNADSIHWSLSVRRFVAPPGTPREAIVTLDWRHVPPDPPEPPRCKKPRPVKAPRGAPRWLRARTLRMTTRQRVSATTVHDPDGVRVSMRVLLRNGETQSGDLTRLVKLAKRLKFERETLDGMHQRWVGKRDTLEWRADNQGLNLGCQITGPVLAIVWTRRRR